MPQYNDTCSYAFMLFYNQPFLVYPDSFSIKRLQFSEQARLLIFIYIYINHSEIALFQFILLYFNSI